MINFFAVLSVVIALDTQIDPASARVRDCAQKSIQSVYAHSESIAKGENRWFPFMDSSYTFVGSTSYGSFARKKKA